MNLKSAFFATLFVAALGGAARADVRAYPVPWVARQSPQPFITFVDLPGGGNIKIYTVAGEEVANLPIPAGENKIDWPVVNSSGRKVASGVYFYRVEGPGTEKQGKLIVIR